MNDKLKLLRGFLIDEFRSRMFWEAELERYESGNGFNRNGNPVDLNKVIAGCKAGIKRSNEEIEKWSKEYNLVKGAL